jgi:predicted ATPase
MLTQLTVKNFKCFTNLRMGFARLTLLTGLNGAGKSTSIQPFLLLAQASRQGANPARLPLNGPLTRLGSAGDIAPTKGQPEFLIEAGNDKISWRLSAIAGERSLAISNASAPGPFTQAAEWQDTVWPPGLGQAHDPARTYSVRSSLAKLIYIGATRASQQEVYPYPDVDADIQGDVGSSGEYAPYWYDQMVDEYVGAKEASPATLRKRLDDLLSSLFAGAQANVTAIPQSSSFALRFKIGESNEWRRPANVGFGLSYSFPILVSLLTSPPGQTLIIDSPEAHLHPSAQSTMGRILADLAAQGIQIIVETHSDHLLNGVRLAVKNKKLSHKDVAIHFFGGVEGAQHGVTSPTMDRDGNINEWPSGFFDQNERDLAHLTGWS